MALADDGKIVVVGTRGRGRGGRWAQLRSDRLNANGSPDATFGNGGTATTSLGTIDRARAVAIQPDGKIILAGLADDGTVNSAIGLVRYNADGTPDTTSAPAAKSGGGGVPTSASRPLTWPSSPTARSSSPGASPTAPGPTSWRSCGTTPTARSTPTSRRAAFGAAATAAGRSAAWRWRRRKHRLRRGRRPHRRPPHFRRRARRPVRPRLPGVWRQPL